MVVRSTITPFLRKARGRISEAGRAGITRVILGEASLGERAGDPA
jgi:hypothetical protein